ncbi:hypothetical protein HU200_023343 [Digitaria exilis]|uniref:MADS-box domain-containing protein n=1 Tax=Digitaria exilis TaxID=1010633 RepID=A0A835C8T5_9POAL|nr:hypothetical protein HU200_023343 [Digitaria exilis]
MVKGKPSMGKQKIDMKRIEHDKARHVCFSKRRQGMFKKASELSILCGALVAVVAFSPAGRPFSFGSPSFKAVMNRFLTLINPATSDQSFDNSSSGETNTIKESLECSELEQSIESEKKRKERLNETIKGDMNGNVMNWLTAKSYPSGLDELQELHQKLAAIQDLVKEKIKLMLQEERHPTMTYPPAFMDLALKYMLDSQPSAYISSIAPNSHHGRDGPDVNASTSGVHAIASMSGPNIQLEG